jgi:hypothetical protein
MISLNRIEKDCDKRARACIYCCASLAWLDNSADGLPDTSDVTTLAKIEQLSKKMRTHRCAFDFDKGYIDLTAKDDVFRYSKVVVVGTLSTSTRLQKTL